jgi:hypothetical protein
MMKKTYMVPSIDQVLMEDEVELLYGSVKGSNGIGYGGVDTEGSKDPDARYYDLDEEE